MPRFDLYKTLLQTGDSIKQLSVFNPFTIHKKGTKTKAIFALALVCFLWGTTWLASEEGVKFIPGITIGRHATNHCRISICNLFFNSRRQIAERKRMDHNTCVKFFKFHVE